MSEKVSCPPKMIRPLLILLLLVPGVESFAQRDSSLTEEFSKLSAKERTRIALKEQEDAGKDAVFQQLMTEGERLFQHRSYEEALAVYKEARKKRPYNVHPKVKIQDLEAFIKERDQRSAENVPPITENSPADPPGKEVHHLGLKNVHPPDPQEQAMGPGEKGSVTKRSPVVKKIAEPANVSEGKGQQEALAGERIYKEAGVVVIERVIEEDGRTVLYRKVVQRSGSTVHFRNGEVVTQRVWEAAFGN